MLNRVENDFPDAGNREMVFNLKGNVLQTQGEKEPAKEYYARALELAQRKENDLVASESLFYLVDSLVKKAATPSTRPSPTTMSFGKNMATLPPIRLKWP